MTAYYNEIEPYAVEWLRNLIKKGLIADGIVDDRSIASVEASDLGDFTQCHFFAGIGVWSYALRLAGWADEREVWTGSCPCQPFSAAGKGKGVEDERHLWPEFHRLIAECRPAVVFGEQVASKDGLGWLDAVCADMEASGYAIGAADLCAAGVGAPHIRQRLWFVGERLADAGCQRRDGEPVRLFSRGQKQAGVETAGGRAASGLADAQGSGGGTGLRDHGSTGQRRDQPADGIGTGGLGNHDHARLEGQRDGHQAEGGRLGAVRPVAEAGEPRGLADAYGRDASAEGLQRGGEHRQQPEDGGVGRLADADVGGWRDEQGKLDGERPSKSCSHDTGGRPRPTNGHWRDADWLHCRDGKWRPVEPQSFPLAHGAPARVGRLRAYGNAIVGQAAAEVIAAFMECRP